MARKRFYNHMNLVIAEMIRELYFDHHWKQRALAEFFKVSQGAVSKIISGQTWQR
jgi:transcriptional regulator with XRE-family HTH domain